MSAAAETRMVPRGIPVHAIGDPTPHSDSAHAAEIPVTGSTELNAAPGMDAQADQVRSLIRRLAPHQNTAIRMDFGRIEELAHLLLCAVQGRPACG